MLTLATAEESQVRCSGTPVASAGLLAVGASIYMIYLLEIVFSSLLTVDDL